MKIPSTVKVAGVNYDVKIDTTLNVNRQLFGEVNYGKSEILIDAHLSDEMKGQIFIHELLHAIFKESGYDDQDEDMVNRLGITLHQVLVDNKLDFEGE